MMHPDLMIEITRLRVREMHTQASEGRLARALRKAARARRAALASAPGQPVIPDYVHEMFGETSTGHPVA
jgi:hypothetical protein